VQQRLLTQERWLDSRLTMTYIVRGAGDPMPLVPALRTAAAEVNRSVPIFNIKTLDDYTGEQLWQPRQTMILLAIFGGMAVTLALTGVYGIMAYAVRLRRHEIGIRMALGATPNDVRRLVIGRGVLLITPGIVIGVAASLTFMRLLESQLWGVTSADPVTYAAVAAAMIVAATLACYLPARRASAMDTAIALRCE